MDNMLIERFGCEFSGILESRSLNRVGAEFENGFGTGTGSHSAPQPRPHTARPTRRKQNRGQRNRKRKTAKPAQYSIARGVPPEGCGAHRRALCASDNAAFRTFRPRRCNFSAGVPLFPFFRICTLCFYQTFTIHAKMKTNAAAKKRFTFTGHGKIKRSARLP